MSLLQIIELIIALAILGWGVWSYRHGGTQGGVILIVIGLLVAVHATGLLEYRPSPAERTQL